MKRLLLVVVCLVLLISGCSKPEGTDTDGQTSATAQVLEESPSVPDETEKTPLQENLEESRAFQAELTETIKDYESNPNYNIIETNSGVLFRLYERNDPETDTLDGYYLESINTGENQWLYVYYESDKYPVLHITSTTASLYIPDGPVINLGEPTPGLSLEEDEQTGDNAGTIDGLDVQYPAQPEGEHVMFIYKDGNLEYGIKIWPITERPGLYGGLLSQFGCADKQLIYTFKTGGLDDPCRLTSFAGMLTEDMIMDGSMKD